MHGAFCMSMVHPSIQGSSLQAAGYCPFPVPASCGQKPLTNSLLYSGAKGITPGMNAVRGTEGGGEGRQV